MNETILKIISKDTGMPEDKIPLSTFDDIHKVIEGKSGEELDYDNELHYLPRGNYYMQEGYLITKREIIKNFNKVFRYNKKVNYRSR